MNREGIIYKLDILLGKVWSAYWTGWDTGWNIWFRTFTPAFVVWSYVVLIANYCFGFWNVWLPPFFLTISKGWFIGLLFGMLPIALIVSALLYGCLTACITFVLVKVVRGWWRGVSE